MIYFKIHVSLHMQSFVKINPRGNFQIYSIFHAILACFRSMLQPKVGSTFYILIDSSFWFDKINLVCSSVSIERSLVIISNSMKIVFVFANSEDPDEMPPHVAFHLGLQCLPKYPFWSHLYINI